MRNRMFLPIAAIMAISCTTPQTMTRLRPGMTKDEVIDIMGNPDGYKAEGEYESLKYSHRLVSGWAWDRADFYVILKNGKTVEWGMGEVRVKEGPTNVLVLIPLK